MFRELEVTPTDFNVICQPITRLPTKRSDKGNGYFIVAGLWGTCFHRIATKKERFEIVANENPKCPHTYTKIPAALADRTYFVYVNYCAGFKVILPAGGIVVGLHEAQPHRIGGWWSQSFLVYSPNGEPPTVIESVDEKSSDEIRLRKSDGTEIGLTVDAIMLGFPVRYIAVNEDGYYKKVCRT